MVNLQRKVMASMTLLSAIACAQLPKNIAVIAYKPDIIGVDRLFMVALKVPAQTGTVTVSVPECVELLDRTPLPTASDMRKYYFKSTASAQQASITFAGPIQALKVVFDIWSFEQLREFRQLKNTQLPRRWPLGERLPELKNGQTVTAPVDKEQQRGRMASTRYLNMSDDDIWGLQPDSTIPRWHWTNVQAGCPVHGTEIYQGRAFYPWLNEKGRDLRSYTAGVPYVWKSMCPVGGELYPSNYLGSEDFTSGAFPDDGFGGACLHQGKRYGFIAEVSQAYCHQMLAVAPSCAQSYLATGNPQYVHKTLVALCRLAVEYAYLGTKALRIERNAKLATRN